MSWSEGYVSGVEYTHGYYREISPSALHLSTLSAGLKTRLGRPIRYLELGFGQGVSLNIHAAACEDEFWGTDFNPSHVAYARELAAISGASVTILESSFAELAAQEDLPEFDVIALHGIWSWVSHENRRAIETIIRRRLAAGGLVYISYNAMPGWSAALPLQHLMYSHSALSESGHKDIRLRIDDALIFTKGIEAAGAGYFSNNPSASPRLQAIMGQDRKYLAHEFFNKDWNPTYFSQVNEFMVDSKLEFSCAANTLQQLDHLFLSPEAKTILEGVQSPLFRETVKDYFSNTQFRKDIFIKGQRLYTPLEQSTLYLNLRFVLMVPAETVAMKVNGPMGEVTLQEDIYRPLVEILAADNYAPKTGGDILKHPLWTGKSAPVLIQALMVLAGADRIHIVQAETTITAVRPRCEALNAHLCDRARFTENVLLLASPVTGGGVAVNRFEQLFLLSRSAGKPTPSDWAQDAWAALMALDQRLLHEGQPIVAEEDNLTELTIQAIDFNQKRLPLLQALGVA